MIVDTHSHAGINWFEPVEMILHQMNLNEVEKTVLIQHGGNYHNGYIIECVKRYPGRFSAVISVDVRDPHAVATLEELSQNPEVVGVRLRPTERSPGPDPLAIWRKAADLHLTVSCFATTTESIADPDFHSLVEKLPNCTIVLEHLAGAYRPQEAPYNDYKKALTLSKFPNTYIKFGGLGEFSVRPVPLAAQFSFADVPPLLDMAYDAFGSKRMMWGSDFPPVGGREGYRNSLQGVLAHSIFEKQEDKDWAFGKTAMEVFKLA